jgi:hypothetical protein
MEKNINRGEHGVPRSFDTICAFSYLRFLAVQFCVLPSVLSRGKILGIDLISSSIKGNLD